MDRPGIIRFIQNKDPKIKLIPTHTKNIVIFNLNPNFKSQNKFNLKFLILNLNWNIKSSLFLKAQQYLDLYTYSKIIQNPISHSHSQT